MENALELAHDLRSIHSENRIYIRIKNLSPQCVDIIWISFSGEYVHYKKLECNNFVDINTFETHPWIAIDSKKKDRMLIDNEFLYMPTNWEEYCRKHFPHIPIASLPQDITPPRFLIYITTPLHSLRYKTILEVRSYFKTESEVDLLDLPNVLKNDLKLSIRERNNLNIIFNV